MHEAFADCTRLGSCIKERRQRRAVRRDDRLNPSTSGRYVLRCRGTVQFNRLRWLIAQDVLRGLQVAKIDQVVREHARRRVGQHGAAGARGLAILALLSGGVGLVL